MTNSPSSNLISEWSHSHLDLDSSHLCSHLLSKIHNTPLTEKPFHHCFIEGVFPEPFYKNLIAYKEMVKTEGIFQDRHQDSSNYVNRRFKLNNRSDPQTTILKQVFSSTAVIRSLLSKFYHGNVDKLLARTRIHKEFEFVFCMPNLLQDIHIDIPPKLLSFIFYLPSQSVSAEAARANATILYDKQLKPSGEARYLPNSVCIFAPHFYTYHGFSTTIERDVMVMFYIDRRELFKWESIDKLSAIYRADRPPYTMIKRAIAKKLCLFPLKEYGLEPARLILERDQCLVNSPRGRVMQCLRPQQGNPEA